MTAAREVPEDDAWYEPAPLGALLRGARERRGLSVGQVADGVRISPRHIRAIEDGDFGALPEGPYRRGFVEVYASFVGVDPAEALARLDADAQRAAAGRTVFRYPPRRRFNWRDWTVPIALAAALAAAGVIRLAGREVPAPLPLPPPLAVAPEPIPPALAKEDAPAPADEAPAGDGGAAPAGVRVILRSEGTTWVAVAHDGGEERRQELAPGENLELLARERLGLTLGDAGLVRVQVGDRELGFVGDRGETRAGMLFVAPRGREAEGPPPAAGD